MKKHFLLLALLITFVSSLIAQSSCSNFCVLGISIDTAVATNHLLKVTLYDLNDSTTEINFPSVMVVNYSGDTIANPNNLYFAGGQQGGDTVIYTVPAVLPRLPLAFSFIVYLEDNISNATCSYIYVNKQDTINGVITNANSITCSPMAINEFAAESNTVSIFPNPASSEINFKIQQVYHQPATIIIYDDNGREVEKFTTTQQLLTISREGLRSGIYFVTVDINNNRISNKLVITE